MAPFHGILHSRLLLQNLVTQNTSLMSFRSILPHSWLVRLSLIWNR